MKKTPFLTQIYIGDTLIDVHGYGRKQIEEVYIANTDIEISEMIHSLNWDEFEKKADEAIYYESI